MKRLRFFLLVGAALAAPFCVADMPEAYRAVPQEVVAAAVRVTEAAYPDAPYVVLDRRLHTAYDASGASVCWEDAWVKVLTVKGCRELSSFTIGFNRRYGEAAILAVELYSPSGTVQTVDFARTLKTATDNSSQASNIVDPLEMETTCAVPGLVPGMIRHVMTRQTMRRTYMPDTWSDRMRLEGFTPVCQEIVTVDQPPERPVVGIELTNPNGKTVTRAPDTSLPNGHTLLQWTIRNVPQAFPEPDMPSPSRCLQTLHLSTISSWQDISRWYWSLCQPHLVPTTPAMTNKVQALVRACTTEPERIRAIFKFVSQEVRYMGLTLEDDSPGFAPHDVNVTFDNRYGVCRDKAVLLVALLRAAGIEAYPVLIQVGSRFNSRVPMPFFNHAIVQAGGQLMDPTNEQARDLFPAYLCNCSYLVCTPVGETLRVSPVVSEADNRLTVRAEAELAADGSALWTAHCTTKGLSDTILRSHFLNRKPSDRRRTIENMLKRLSQGAELFTFDYTPSDLRDTDTPLSFTVCARFPDLVLKGATLESLNVPFFTSVFNVTEWMLAGSTALEERRFPLEYNSTVGSEETLEFKTGEYLGKVLDLPAAVSVTNVPGYRYERDYRAEKGILKAHRAQGLTAVEFAVPTYVRLRAACADVEAAQKEHPLFAPEPLANANIHTLLDRTEVCLASPFTWVVTNTTEEVVLTAKGKKDAAEQVYSFTPSVGSVELVSATVSNVSGRVYAVTPKEINVVDASWVSSAPCYPVAKKMIVNLPGVEIGSVIRTIVARTVRRAPLAFRATYTFDSMQPVDRVEVRVTAPVEMKLTVETLGTWPTNAAYHEGTAYFWCVDHPKRLPDERGMPAAEFWRREVRLSSASWEEYGTALETALARARAAGCEKTRHLAETLTASAATPEEKVTALRTWLVNRIRKTQPGLFAVPFDLAFTPPDRALEEGYASKGDYMNLLYTLLEGAGFSCSWVLADSAAGDYAGRFERRLRVPDPAWFDAPVIRAEAASAWWWPFGAGEVFWVGGENEFTPPEASSHYGERYFEPASAAFGRIEPNASETNYLSRTADTLVLTVRENGAVDFDVEELTWGSGVGGFRKRYREMTPEKRSRHFQDLLGDLAQGATATGEFVTDTASYPARRAYSAYAAHYAVAEGDALTVTLPGWSDAVFGTGLQPMRQSPFAIGARAPSVCAFEVIFPSGYAVAEALPPDLAFTDPCGRVPPEKWYLRQKTRTWTDAEGRLHVKVVREIAREQALIYAPDYAPLFREWNERASRPAIRTIMVRRLALGR